jgi:hypothetical protein
MKDMLAFFPGFIARSGKRIENGSSIRRSRAPDAAQRVALREAVRCRAGAHQALRVVMRGLDPRIHPSSQEFSEEDGLPGQARQ